MFSVKVTFRFLRTGRDSLHPLEPIVFSINSPTLSEHVPFSPAHRFLVMLLRRGYLANHSTIDSLLAGDERIIQIQETALELPVLLGGKARGLGITDQPMSAKALAEYSVNATTSAGYGLGGTTYAWRRKAGTEVQRQFGTEKAKEFMSHSVSSTSETFHRYYNQGLFDLPVFEIAMKADTNIAAAKMDEDSLAVLARAVDLSKVKGIYLQRAVIALELKDQELLAAQQACDWKTVRNAKKRIKREAFTKLYAEEVKKARDTMTVEEFEARKRELQTGPKLMEKIAQAAEKTSSGSQSNSHQSLQQSNDDSGFAKRVEGHSFPDPDMMDEDDFEAGLGPVTVDVDYDDEEIEIPHDFEESADEFSEYVRIFMTSLLQERFFLQEYQDLHCQLCIEDETIDQDAKAKVWQNPIKLRTHQGSSIHSRFLQWYRKTKMAFDQDENATRWVCPYGTSCRSYTDQNKLRMHIESSTAESTSMEHDEAKRLDGWYDADWRYEPFSNDREQQKRARKTIGLVYNDEKEGETTELKLTSEYSIMEAPGPEGFAIFPMYKGIIFGGNEGDIEAVWREPIPEMYSGIVFSGDMAESRASHGG